MSNKNRLERRKKEILKAQSNTSVRGQFQQAVEVDFKPKKQAERLNLAVIKTDLIKTTVFAVVVVVFLFALKYLKV